MARPLNKLLGSKRLLWTSECQTAFDQMKDALTTPPVLAYPDFQSAEPFRLYTDASNTGVGACLLQVQENVYRVIAYISTTFNVHELKYSVLDKELAAIRWATVMVFRPFIYEVPFTLYTDHKIKINRTMLELDEYDMEIRDATLEIVIRGLQLKFSNKYSSIWQFFFTALDADVNT